MENILDEDLAKSKNPSLADWATFIGIPNDKYYIQKWLELEESNKYSFNIGAFFFGLLWLVYRKMYVESIILLGFILLEGMIEEFLLAQFDYFDATTTNLISIVVSIAISTIVGFLGNKLYLNHTNRKIEAIKKEKHSAEAYQQILKERGGTSMTAAIIGLLLYMLFFAGIAILLDMAA